MSQPKTAILDGKDFHYSERTEFRVQVGRGRGTYSTRYKFTGDLRQAVFYYRCLNIGNGYKKRLLCKNEGARTVTLARHLS